MKKIKIVSGTYGHNVNGIVKPKTRESEPFYVEDKEADRLIALEVAAEVAEKEVATPRNGVEGTGSTNNPSDGENGTGGADGGKTATGHFDEAQLRETKNEELKKLCEDLGLDTSKMKKKDDYIKALLEVEVNVPDDGDDEPPASGATNPVI